MSASADGGKSPTSLSAFVTKSRSLFTVGFTGAMLVVMMNGLFYRASITFLPEVLGGFLPNVTEFVQLFDPESPLAGEFDLASYLYVGLLVIGIAGQYVGGKVSDSLNPTTALTIVFNGLEVVTVGFAPATRVGTAPLVVVSGLFGFLLFALQRCTRPSSPRCRPRRHAGSPTATRISPTSGWELAAQSSRDTCSRSPPSTTPSWCSRYCPFSGRHWHSVSDSCRMPLSPNRSTSCLSVRLGGHAAKQTLPGRGGRRFSQNENTGCCVGSVTVINSWTLTDPETDNCYFTLEVS